MSKLRPEDQGLRPDGDVAKSERQLWPKGPLRQEQGEREEESVGTCQQGCSSALSTRGVPLGVLKGRSPGDLLEVHVVSPGPAGSETGREARHPVSTSPRVGASLFAGTPCRAPARNGRGHRQWAAWHAAPLMGVCHSRGPQLRNRSALTLCLPCG